MPRTDPLFELTKSLSRSEKRQFHLLSSSYGGHKNHLELYRSLQKQAVSGQYREDLLKREFSNQAFARQLHVTKNYLKRQLLNSLRQVHNQISVDSVLKDQIRDLEILFNKGLYRQCWSVLKKCRKLARKFEKLSVMLELLSWERNLVLTEKGTSQGIGEVRRIVEEEEAIIKKLSNLNDYWRICIDLIQSNFTGNPETTGIQAYARETLLESEAHAITYQSRRMYYFILYVASIFEGDIQKGYENALAGIRFIESQPHQIQEDPLTYVATINNLIPVCFQLGKYEEAEALIRKIRAIPGTYDLPDFEHLYYRVFVRTYNHELELNRDLARIDRGIELAQEVETFIQRFEGILSADYRTLFHYQLAYFYFADARYSSALQHLNRILVDRKDPRDDIQSYGRVLNLMVHYELKNYDLIEYLCRSTRRFLNKKNRLYGFEKTILEFFGQVSRTQNIQAISNLKQLRNNIVAMEEDQSEPLDYINVLVWIQSKLNRDTFKNTLINSKQIL